MKGQILKKSEILIRLKEIFDLTKLDAKLTQEQADLIECNMQMQNILLSCKSVGILRKSVGWDLAKTKTSKTKTSKETKTRGKPRKKRKQEK